MLSFVIDPLFVVRVQLFHVCKIFCDNIRAQKNNICIDIDS